MPESSYGVQLPDGSMAIVTAEAVNPSQLPQPLVVTFLAAGGGIKVGEFAKLCEPHIGAIFVTIAGMALLFGLGGALKPLAMAAAKRWFGAGGTEVTVNLNPEDEVIHDDHAREQRAREQAVVCHTCTATGTLVAVDPSKCPMHEAERQRSLRNEEQIKELWKHIEEVQAETKKDTAEIKRLAAENNTITQANLAAILTELRILNQKRKRS